MPYRRFDWHEHIQRVWGEYWSAREAVDRLRAAVTATPVLLAQAPLARRHLHRAHENLEGTYIVRLFAAFEAVLRSFDRAAHKDSSRQTDAAVMIDQIGGKRGRGIPASTRQKAHEVRLVRNFWAHEADADPGRMNIDDARSRLQRYLSELPEEW